MTRPIPSNDLCQREYERAVYYALSQCRGSCEQGDKPCNCRPDAEMACTAGEEPPMSWQEKAVAGAITGFVYFIGLVAFVADWLLSESFDFRGEE